MTTDVEYKLQQATAVYNVDLAFFVQIHCEGQTYHLLPHPPD